MNRKMFIGAIAFGMFLVLLEVNSPGDRLLHAATTRVLRFARNALEVLIAYS